MDIQARLDEMTEFTQRSVVKERKHNYWRGFRVGSLLACLVIVAIVFGMNGYTRYTEAQRIHDCIYHNFFPANIQACKDQNSAVFYWK